MASFFNMPFRNPFADEEEDEEEDLTDDEDLTDMSPLPPGDPNYDICPQPHICPQPKEESNSEERSPSPPSQAMPSTASQEEGRPGLFRADTNSISRSPVKQQLDRDGYTSDDARSAITYISSYFRSTENLSSNRVPPNISSGSDSEIEQDEGERVRGLSASLESEDETPLLGDNGSTYSISQASTSSGSDRYDPDLDAGLEFRGRHNQDDSADTLPYNASRKPYNMLIGLDGIESGNEAFKDPLLPGFGKSKTLKNITH